MIDQFPPTTKLLQVPLLPEVACWAESIKLSDIINPSHQSRKFVRNLSSEVSNRLRNWIEPFLDCKDFPFVLPTQGVSHAIESWLLYEKREIYMLAGDYGWPLMLTGQIKQVNHFDEIPRGAVLYISNPSAINGNFLASWKDLSLLPCGIVLDCTYLGTTKRQSIPLHDNVERVFLSFSKSFGLQYLRMGWSISKKLLPGEEALNEVSYHSLLNLVLTDEITKKFESDFCHQKLREQQIRICKKWNLTPADVVLLGLSDDPSLRDFRRNPNSPARISLSEYFELDEKT